MAADFMPNTLHINTALGQVETCDYKVEDRHGTKSYAIHDPITIKEGSVTIFSGDIDGVSVESLDSPYNLNSAGVAQGSPVGARIWSIRGVGKTHLAGRYLTGYKVFLPGSLMATAVGYFAGLMGITSSTTIGILAFTNEFICDYEYVKDALDRLADLVTATLGSPLYWRIGTPADVTTLEFGLSVSGGGLIGLNPGGYPVRAGSTTVNSTREQYANAVVLKLDKYLVDVAVDHYDSNGDLIETDHFNTYREYFDESDFTIGYVQVSAPLAGAPSISITGDPGGTRPETVPTITVGIKGVDTGKDFYWNTGSPIITTGLSVTTYGDEQILVEYTPLDIRVLTATGDQTPGVFQAVIQQGDSNNSASPATQAAAELARRNHITVIVNTTVRMAAGTYRVGSTVGVWLPKFSTYGSFYIRSMKEFDEDGILIWRQLELVNGPMIYSASQFMRRLTR